MSVHAAFRFEQGDLVPYELPWTRGQTWEEVLREQRFSKHVCLSLGRQHTGLRVEVYEAENLSLPDQEFAFLALVHVGETSHPVFCRDLP
jgi:hypothetical protein